MPGISVIVPVYNTERYLNTCIESILRQTRADLELILIDDGSTDRSPRICDEWAERDARVTVIHRENGGAGAARNAGLRIASGAYVAFVDSDDWIEETMLARLMELILEHRADMCVCGLRMVRGERPRRRGSKPRTEMWGRRECLDRFFRLHGEEDTHRVCGGIFAKSLLRGFSFCEGRMNEDVLACYQLAARCRRAVYTSEAFYNYRQNRSGVTNCRFNMKKLDLLAMWDAVGAMVPAVTPQYARACEMNRKRAYFTLLSAMLVHGFDRHDARQRRVYRELKRMVRGYFWELMSWKMPLSRKLLLCAVVL